MMLKNAPRVVSLVPSWTETLIAAGVNVVGRTRFCIHPAEVVKAIPQLGGTKDLQMDKIKKLQPDFIVIDKEENTLEMAQALTLMGCEILVTQVSDFASVILACKHLSRALNNLQLNAFADRYSAVIPFIDTELFLTNCLLRGEIEPLESINHFEYVIWKNPFMVVGQNTFIADNLKLVGIPIRHLEKYPSLTESELKNAFCLFSSEPYPFLKNYDQLLQQGFRGVVLDGEKLSWFGIRNLNFLESSTQ